jgi:CRISPR/Cas system CSM-associated protein Csm3 (group 7 of RAMP superfamily)
MGKRRPSTPFINPYNFVRYKTNPSHIDAQRQTQISGHDKFIGHSGRLTCELITLSRIFVGDSYNRNNFYRIKGLPGIPGSSIKGTIRSVAEVISSACFSMISENYEYEYHPSNTRPTATSSVGVSYQILPKTRRNGGQATTTRGLLRWNIKFQHFSKGSTPVLLDQALTHYACVLDKLNNNGLCICCRAFGSSTSSDEVQAFGGKVCFNDGVIGFINQQHKFIAYTQNTFHNNQSSIIHTAYKKSQTAINPKPHQESFYLDNGRIRGRKFYYHQQSDNLENEGEISMEVLQPNIAFQFTIDYNNLSEIELGLLCLALQLEWDETNNTGIAHKIGQGKPIGLGSARIKIVKIEEVSATVDRYKRIQSMMPITDSAQVQSKVQSWIDALKSDHNSFYQQGWEDLRDILHYPPYNYPIEYPDQAWFGNNRSFQLPQPDQVRTATRMLRK